MKFLLPLCFVILTLTGCQSGIIPDPNDGKSETKNPASLRASLASVAEGLLARRMRKEISSDEYRALIVQAAQELIAEIDLQSVPRNQLWEYADVLRTARDWESADKLYELAIEHAEETKNEDRRINDLLRRAHVKANLKDPASAIALVKETFNAAPVDSAPILPAVLYEIVPDARAQGKDYDLAVLLEHAVDKHLLTQVDPDSEAGIAFENAKVHHVELAWRLAAELYDRAGSSALSQAALERVEKLSRSTSLAEWEERARQRAEAAPPRDVPTVDL